MPVDPLGLTGPTRAQARGLAWRRSSHGLFVPACTHRDLAEQRIVEAAGILPSYGGVTGWATLRWLGGRWFEGLASDRVRRDVQLVTGPGDVRPQPGIAVSAEHVTPEDLVVVDGLRTTTAVYAACWEMRHARSLLEAVRVVDMAAYNDLVSIAEMQAFAATQNSRTGIPLCRKAINLADENSWSPMETWLRLVWVLVAELPPPLCNVPIFDLDGNLIGVPDLFDEEAGMLGEYDGEVHLNATARGRDERRMDRFRDAGLECVTALADEQSNPDRLAARLLAARRRARFLPPGSRRWTTVKPDWWEPTETVAQRRALSPRQRDRLLSHRAIQPPARDSP